MKHYLERGRRVWSIFGKSMREQMRDVPTLSLTLIFAPLFVFLYSLFFPSGSTSYGVLVINNDAGIQSANGASLEAGAQAIQAIRAVVYADGSPLLRVKVLDDRAQAEKLLRDREATAFLVIPPDFSRALYAARSGDHSLTANITFGGDLTNPYYAVAAILATGAVEAYVQQATGQQPAIQYIEEALGATAARTEFETYVPGILVFAVIMLVFQSSMTLAREVEAGTLHRLQITRMTAFDLLSGITASQVLVGVVSIGLTFLTALALGFRSQGPVWLAILVGAVTSLSIIGAGLMVACFSKSVARAFVIANFPLGLFMFFSGVIYPMPRVTLFTLAGRSIGLYDILPPTHAVVALNKVLSLGMGLGDVAYELGALLILSVVYFAVGVWLFQRTHLKAA